ncbi:protein-L-isoaspartate(D-aspartate) O-methyltransferase [Myxosarcina sp. GI1]|uniref:protein-L-isoaspartate(D-aspartate) O-methyltransferase n=1 Tax=Myxosarcina sp. GI1 TaxID=1541065 RepID=UPI000AFD1433|nr:protein-L-isoaspartate(D-aspartate) O-methyltransferase [Myxosarcina sp. GI1]
MNFRLVAIALLGCCILLIIKPGFAAKISSNFSEFQQPFYLATEQFELQRRQMVEYQLKERGIKDRQVLAVMLKVPRHQFVDSFKRDLAYSDRPIPIGYNQTISQPYIVAYMSEAVEISAGDRVLEIGTGCGYQAAILGELAKEVYSVEIIPQLADKARQTLSQLGYQNIEVKTGDGYQGWKTHAPYDVIIVTAAPEQIPQSLIDQLAINGKMVIPVGNRNQEMYVLTKTADGTVEEKTFPVRFVPMIKTPPTSDR